MVNDENIDCINQSGIILEDDDEEEEDEDDVSQNRDSRDDESSDGEEEGFVKKYICNTNLVIQRVRRLFIFLLRMFFFKFTFFKD